MSGEQNEFSAAAAKVSEAEQAAARIEESSGVAAPRSFLGRGPIVSPERQWEFNRAVVAALGEMLHALQNVLSAQNARLLRVEESAIAALTMGERLHETQTRTHQLEVRLEDELARIAAQLEAQSKTLQEAQTTSSVSAQKVESVTAEVRERIQALLDEQRVCLRQLALQTTEESVLADRARRATELRLEELARRLEKLGSVAAA